MEYIHTVDVHHYYSFEGLRVLGNFGKIHADVPSLLAHFPKGKGKVQSTLTMVHTVDLVIHTLPDLLLIKALQATNLHELTALFARVRNVLTVPIIATHALPENRYLAIVPDQRYAALTVIAGDDIPTEGYLVGKT